MGWGWERLQGALVGEIRRESGGGGARGVGGEGVGGEAGRSREREGQQISPPTFLPKFLVVPLVIEE